jgi:hypothetical protein
VLDRVPALGVGRHHSGIEGRDADGFAAHAVLEVRLPEAI